SLRAAVETAGHVDADLAGTGKLQLFYLVFRVIAYLDRAVVRAALLPGRAVVAAEKHMPCVVAHEIPSAGRIERPQVQPCGTGYQATPGLYDGGGLWRAGHQF